MVKIDGISIKLKATDTTYTKCRATTLSNLDKDLQWYSLNQPTTDPFYVISDNSVFIYPSPTEVIAGGILFYGIGDPIELLTGGTEASVKIPLEYHYMIPLGMEQFIFGARRLDNEKAQAKNNYEVEKQKMVSGITDRIETPQTSTMPDLTHLK